MENFDPTQPSQGLGDTIAKITHYTGISKLTEVITEALGIEDCGCNSRHEWANNFLPYNVEANSPQIYDHSTATPAEEGIYEVLHEIHASKAGQKYNYKIGEKILINESHLLYSDWPYYILIGAVKKIN